MFEMHVLKASKLNYSSLGQTTKGDQFAQGVKISPFSPFDGALWFETFFLFHALNVILSHKWSTQLPGRSFVVYLV